MATDFDPSREVTALANAVEHWTGHNGKTYIVLKLVSEGIVSENSKFQRMGAKHTFVPFAPHITLSDDTPITEYMQDVIERINRRFAYKPLELVFTGQIIGDLED
jgi:hypothetical protein